MAAVASPQAIKASISFVLFIFVSSFGYQHPKGFPGKLF
jgi:hypothetical protein